MTKSEAEKIVLQHEIVMPKTPDEKFHNSDTLSTELNLAQNPATTAATFNFIHEVGKNCKVEDLILPF